MDISTWLNAVFLGVLEGLTEFLPVSSTGHLILFGELLGFTGAVSHTFEVVIQLGAILAVCWLFRAKLLHVAATLLRDAGAMRFAAAVILGFIPTGIAGVLLYSRIKALFDHPVTIAGALLVGGIAILAVERWKPAPRYAEIERFPPLLAIGIGCAQILSMFPGVSRAGATIMGAMMLRVDRKTATEFSFFLSIPTMFAATLYDLYKNRGLITFDGAGLIAVGFVVAFATAFVVVRWFIGFVSRHDFTLFAWYRIAVGIIMLAILIGR
jgi:undecaprenyl-diphosphatase